MYKNGFVLAVMHPKGKSYVEDKEKVYLPEDAPFKVRIKNNTSDYAEVEIKIAGKDYGTFDLEPNTDKDIEGLTFSKQTMEDLANIVKDADGIPMVTETEKNIVEATFRRLPTKEIVRNHHHWYPRYRYWTWDDLVYRPIWQVFPENCTWIGTTNVPVKWKNPTITCDTNANGFTTMEYSAGSSSMSIQSSCTTNIPEIAEKLKELPGKIQTDQIKLPEKSTRTTTIRLELVIGNPPNNNFCPNCGNERKPEWNHCPNCGKKF